MNSCVPAVRMHDCTAATISKSAAVVGIRRMMVKTANEKTANTNAKRLTCSISPQGSRQSPIAGCGYPLLRRNRRAAGYGEQHGHRARYVSKCPVGGTVETADPTDGAHL